MSCNYNYCRSICISSSNYYYCINYASIDNAYRSFDEHVGYGFRVFDVWQTNTYYVNLLDVSCRDLRWNNVGVNVCSRRMQGRTFRNLLSRSEISITLQLTLNSRSNIQKSAFSMHPKELQIYKISMKHRGLIINSNLCRSF